MYKGHHVIHALCTVLLLSRRIMQHIRRGDLMEQKYWDKFFATGNVEDYLSYKMQEPAAEKGRIKEKSLGVSSCESDCADRYGSV